MTTHPSDRFPVATINVGFDEGRHVTDADRVAGTKARQRPLDAVKRDGL